MDGQLTAAKYPDKIRRVIYWDDVNKRKFIFFTNALDISPMMVAELYHQRWQIELFFKWLKQHLKIKKFWGETENAVRIQIYTAIIAYVMIAIVQKKMGIKRPIYEMLQIASISVTDTTPLEALFAKPNYNMDIKKYQKELADKPLEEQVTRVLYDIIDYIWYQTPEE